MAGFASPRLFKAVAMKNVSIGLSLLAVTLACGSAVRAQESSPDGSVTLAVGLPAELTLGKPPTAQTINLTLVNNSAAAITLRKSNECETHLWTITDAGGAAVDDREMCMMIFMPVTVTIAAHGRFEAAESLTLDGAKFHDGARYTLHYRFWGIASDAPFMVHVKG